MSLSRKFLSNAALSTALVFGAVSAPALADVPAVGQCGPAEVVKTELSKAGYGNYFVYDTELFDNGRNAARWARESVYADSGMTKGYHVGRRGENDQEMCVFGALTELVLADNAEQAKLRKVDQRFYKRQPKADVRNGLNLVLDTGAERVGEYPVLQARIRHSNGGEGYMTLSANPDTHRGAILLSEFSGTIVAANSIEAGRKPRTGFTPAAQDVLAQMKSGKRTDAGHPQVIASASPKL